MFCIFDEFVFNRKFFKTISTAEISFYLYKYIWMKMKSLADNKTMDNKTMISVFDNSNKLPFVSNKDKI